MPQVPFNDDARPDDVASVVVEQRDRLLRAICAATGLDQHAAEDVLSKVTERALRNGLAPRGESCLAYMRQAVRREAVSEVRRAARAADREIAAYQLSGVDATVDGVMARMVWLDAMADLDRLPEVERRVFWLRHYEALTYAEIAAAAGLTEDAVDARLRQAAKRLRAMQEQRESSRAYLLLAALARVSRQAETTAPAALAVTGATVLSVLAVLAAPGPRLVHAGTPPRHADVVHGRLHREHATRPQPHRPDASRGADATDVAPAPRAARRPAAPTGDPVVPPVSLCVVNTCVGSTPGDPAHRGDRIEIVRVREVAAGQRVTPACWALPQNPEVTCTSSGDPDHYYVRDPRQDRPHATGNSTPSAPAPREPTKGPHR